MSDNQLRVLLPIESPYLFAHVRYEGEKKNWGVLKERAHQVASRLEEMLEQVMVAPSNDQWGMLVVEPANTGALVLAAILKQRHPIYVSFERYCSTGSLKPYHQKKRNKKMILQLPCGEAIMKTLDEIEQENLSLCENIPRSLMVCSRAVVFHVHTTDASDEQPLSPPRNDFAHLRVDVQ